MQHYLRQPFPAAIAAAIITWMYMTVKDKMNGVTGKNSRYTKPATLVAILVYFIVYIGHMNTEPLMG